ncbi:MAG: helix-turn-helix domain-containing protein [Lentisphaeria bacterium]|nr:helix-turn-helix domain-containing protein [Lentisphaeria bacterium]
MLTSKQQQRVGRLLNQCRTHVETGAAFISVNSSDFPEMTNGFCAFCRRCLVEEGTAVHCRQAILGGAHQAFQTGEPYYFRCWAGLNTVVLPVAPSGKLEGAIELGGFFYTGEREDSSSFAGEAVKRLGNRGGGALPSMVECVRELSSAAVRGAASFVSEALCWVGLNDVDRMQERHARYLQQRRIGELIQASSSTAALPEEYFSLFAAFQHAFRDRDGKRTMILLDDFFSRVMLSTSLDTDRIKAHVHLLLAFLARESILVGGTPLQQAVSTHFRDFRELEEIHELEDLCYWTSKQVERYLAGLVGETVAGQTLAQRTVAWLEANYWRKATLAVTALEVGASGSAIKQALRKETGRPLHAHLLDIRLHQARNELADSDTPIATIAVRCGFHDQSHLSRRFKEVFGLSPGRYRRLSQGT